MIIRRNPSIHITKTDFRGIVGRVWRSDMKVEEFIDEVFKLAKSKSISSRSLLLNNDKLMKKADKILMASNDDTYLFTKTIQLIRRRLKHRGITPIKENSRDWGICKEITANALNFCNDFNLDREEGFAFYIEIGIKLTQKFFIAKFINLHEAICTNYEAKQIIRSDKRPEDTKKLHNLFQREIIDKIGHSTDYSDKPDKYQYFVTARIQADNLNIKYLDYIKAQFDAFEWRSSIPEPIQLIGEKALERVIKYAYKNNIVIRAPKNIGKIDFKKIRQNG